MPDFYVDLHIHIGRDKYDRPVKITGSKNLTLSRILEDASRRKGLDMIGIIDAQSPAVQEEIMDLIESKKAKELAEGGIQFEDTVLILGSEIEVYDASCSGPIHVLCYFPFLEDMKLFTSWLSEKMKNVSLSSQRFYGTARELQEHVKSHKGLFIPAHMFTPFKSLYGKGVKKSLHEVLDSEKIDAVELGLSADTNMADRLLELEPYTYLTNSDAHSLINMAREYQKVRMKTRTFEELRRALYREGERGGAANYGLNPEMGKYHQTFCLQCESTHPGFSSSCNHCGSSKIIKGVSDRIQELEDGYQNRKRPPYIYQVPLSSLPGVGKRTYEKLIDTFGSEMKVIHDIPCEQLQKVVPDKVCQNILALRQGELKITAGGGGRYGRIK
ncbi:endonuclease Q family protein [Halobacillus litoralis]|uniref:endonuclease Q family protein n=1 Tax=Halobacillus litoralis TaxID=45668 RepID=UPI001CFEA5A5|nr:endonuclease Q family protein [Halobacillus litoralis]